MQITDVQVHPLAIPIAPSDPPTSWIWGDFNQIIIAVHTDAGLIGYGEAYGYGVPHATTAVIAQVLRPLLLGADPTQITTLHEQMYRQTHLFGRYGITTFAISGVDIALWDIAAKCAGLPLYRLLGGASSSRIPAYASLVHYSDPQDVGRACRQALQAGYTAVKLHQRDVASLRAARDAVGDQVRLMMDINCAWTPQEALRMARQCAPYHLYWLEEPLWPPEDFAALARLGQLSGTALASGENACTVYQFHQMLAAGAVTYIQPSVTKVGGISEWCKIAALAAAYNVTIAPHAPYFGPGFLATMHLLAATPHATWLEYLFVNLEAHIFKAFPAPEAGTFPLPQGPGLGLEIDREVLERYQGADH